MLLVNVDLFYESILSIENKSFAFTRSFQTCCMFWIERTKSCRDNRRSERKRKRAGVRVWPMVISALGIVIKGLVQKLEDLEIRGRVEAIQFTASRGRPGDLKRLAVTQTPVRNHQLTLVWKTRKGIIKRTCQHRRQRSRIDTTTRRRHRKTRTRTDNGHQKQYWQHDR